MRTKANIVPYSPMLVDDRPFQLDAPGWIYEIKYDGERLVAEILPMGVVLHSKTGTEVTKWFPEIAIALQQLGPGHVLDGEVCVLDRTGRTDQIQLHERIKHRRLYKGAPAVTYCVFDLLTEKGSDLTKLPLLLRKARLALLLKRPPPGVIYVNHFEEGEGRRAFEDWVLGRGLEGLVAKRAVSTYQPGTRTNDWVKVKRSGIAH